MKKVYSFVKWFFLIFYNFLIIIFVIIPNIIQKIWVILKTRIFLDSSN